MASHMNAQRTATQRNALSEILIDYILQKFISILYKDGYIKAEVRPERQKKFTRNDCQDVYDHYFEVEFTGKNGMKGKTEFWGQTTCYKGNVTGKPESNKTYEIRETLVEALSLRKWLLIEKTPFRTIHFTLGPLNYTYGWFAYAKRNTFDLSLYPRYKGTADFFELLLDLGDGLEYEFEVYEKLDEISKDETHPMREFINTTLDSLMQYVVGGCPSQPIATMQAELLIKNQMTPTEINEYVHSSEKSGMDIKGKTIELLEGQDSDDEYLLKTIKRLNITNPFLPVALDASSNWASWAQRAFAIPSQCTSLTEYILHLWKIVNEDRYVIHRLLFRVYTTGGINYIQDIDVDGVTEHNLYNGIHNDMQAEAITNYLLEKYLANGITTVDSLYTALTSTRSKTRVIEALRFERINGTSLKPSLFYLEEYLKEQFDILSFDDAGMDAPVGYYTEFSEDITPFSYANMKVVVSRRTKRPLAVIKGKFFRQPEFPRRVKEESYVGITTKYTYRNGIFSLSYGDLPLVMFIDMAKNYTPPAYAIRRIINYGWIPFFDSNKLLNFLINREEQ